MEIEKKYLIKELPEDLQSYPHHVLEQSYLCVDPVVRVRKIDESYVLTTKSRDIPEAAESNLCVANEWECSLSEEAYLKLREKADGTVIKKTRYKIPYGDYTIELDVFYGEYEGMKLAEVEFPSIEAAREFVAPDWFGEDVSDDFRYRNNYLATKHK